MGCARVGLSLDRPEIVLLLGQDSDGEAMGRFWNRSAGRVATFEECLDVFGDRAAVAEDVGELDDLGVSDA